MSSFRSLVRTYVLWISPVLVLLVAGVVVYTAYAGSLTPPEPEHLDRELELYKEIRQAILERYVGEVDVEELMLSALEGLTRPLDRHSVLQRPDAWREFQKSTEGVIHGGIGVRIRRTGDQIQIVTPLLDSPALEAGIQAGDLLRRVDGTEIDGLDTQDVVHLLSGEIGTRVTLAVHREGQGALLEYTLQRQRIELQSVAQLGFADRAEGIAYLRLASFQEDSAQEVAAAIDRLEAEGMRSLIFDLRFNPGGRLSAATGIADLFLEEGDIVLTQSRTGAPHRKVAHADGTLPDFPVVLLVNEESASASEVVGGALQDHQRALLVGERTWGKGSVQELFPLDDNRMALKLTTKRYLTPHGKSLHREPSSRVWGLLPDVLVEMGEEDQKVLLEAWDEAEIIHGQPDQRPMVDPTPDRQLQMALEILLGTTVLGDPVTGK